MCFMAFTSSSSRPPPPLPSSSGPCLGIVITKGNDATAFEPEEEGWEHDEDDEVQLSVNDL